MKRSYLTAKEAEQVMQETRNQDGFTGKNEKILVNTMVKNAKANNRIGDKLLMVIDPKYIHIPEWQRNIRLEKAYAIGNNYDKYKWDAPKILLFEDKYLCIDGQHRIFGAFKAKKEDVVCEVMECTMEEKDLRDMKLCIIMKGNIDYQQVIHRYSKHAKQQKCIKSIMNYTHGLMIPW